MTSKKQQKPAYTQEFKDTAIKLALVGNKRVSEVSRERGIPEWKRRDWVRDWNTKKSGNAEQQLARSADERLRQLEKRNKQLEMENEILRSEEHTSELQS